MPANVRSTDAIVEFRSALCTFIHEARQAIASMDMEARRAVEYITHDQANYWTTEARRGGEAVAERKQELSNSQTFKTIDRYTPSCIEEKKQLEKAQRRLMHAQQKIDAVKHWGRLSEQQYREFLTRLSQFTSVLDGDLPRAVSVLDRILKSLDQYLSTQTPSGLAAETFASAVGSGVAETSSATDAPVASVENGEIAEQVPSSLAAESEQSTLAEPNTSASSIVQSGSGEPAERSTRP
ncbi:MAG: hypothetical protein SGJ20_01650 [Planctomycetota bacterium]|nr:hypothetical protein [Planctomycetota bacterium]